MAERIFRGFLFLSRRIFSRIFSPDFFSSFLWGKSAQKNPPRKSPGKSSKIYTTKILRHISADWPGQKKLGAPNLLFWGDFPEFPNAVVLNAVVRRNTQMSAKECKCPQKSANASPQKSANASPQKSAKGRKRAQKSAKERKNCKQPGLKQPGLGTPKILGGENVLGLVPASLPHTLGYACTFYAPTSPPPMGRTPRIRTESPRKGPRMGFECFYRKPPL